MGVPAEHVSINQITTRRWTLGQAIDGCARHGAGGIAVWRDRLAELGLAEARRRLTASGLAVSGLNRAGPLLHAEAAAREAALEDARRAVAEAEAIGAACLMVLPGGLPEGSRDLPAARRMLEEMLGRLLEAARAAGVSLALEPLHPQYAAERSMLNTLAQANTLIERLGPGIGLVVDAYHCWWDPALGQEIARAGDGRLLGFHVCDWLVPTRDPLLDRGMPGDGVIDLAGMRSMVEAAGYTGLVEVELFSTRWWEEDPDLVVRLCLERCATRL